MNPYEPTTSSVETDFVKTYEAYFFRGQKGSSPFLTTYNLLVSAYLF